MGRATLWVDKGWIHVRTPFDRAFIDALKALVPASDRRWDNDEKIWKVAAAWANELEPLVTRFYGPPTILEPEVVVVAAPAGAAHDPFGALLRLAGDDALKRIYRQLAAELHPDRGGSPERMIELNQAWEQIRKERGIQ